MIQKKKLRYIILSCLLLLMAGLNVIVGPRQQESLFAWDNLTQYEQDLAYITQQYDIHSRLIVYSNSTIFDNNAIARAGGFGRLTVLQYETLQDALAAQQQFQNNTAVDFVMMDGEQCLSILEEDQSLKIQYQQNTSRVLSTTIDTASALSWGTDILGVKDYQSAITAKHGDNLTTNYVAVIDTGVDGDHPYLEGRIAEELGKSYIAGTTWTDDHYHGTHVAGTIVDLTLDNVKIIPIKTLSSSGSGTNASILSAVEYCIALKEKGYNLSAINMSLGGYGDDEFATNMNTLITQAKNLGVVTCVAAGNEHFFVEQSSPSNCVEAWTITSLTPNYFYTEDTLYNGQYFMDSYSNTGELVDLCLPGTDILSCVPSTYSGSSTIYTDSEGGQYIAISGTSMATPHASALVALVATYYGQDVTYTQLSSIITTAYDYGTVGKDDCYGYGVPNLVRTLATSITLPTLSYGSFDQVSYFDFDKSVSITTSNENDVVLYTLDGSYPMIETGTTYTGPITIRESTKLSVVVYRYQNDQLVAYSDLGVAYYYKGDSTTSSEGNFSINSSGYITAYNGGVEDVVIPSTVGGVAVKGLYDCRVFYGRNITSITSDVALDVAFEDSVLRPNDWIVANCPTLRTIHLPNTTYTLIAYECDGLKEVYLDSLTTLEAAETSTYAYEYYGTRSFYGCVHLETISIPKVTSLPAYAFEGYEHLRDLEVDSVQSIYNYVFAYCTSLKTLELPNVLTASAYAFSGCTHVEVMMLSKYVTSVNAMYFTDLANAVVYCYSDAVGQSIGKEYHLLTPSLVVAENEPNYTYTGYDVTMKMYLSSDDTIDTADTLVETKTMDGIGVDALYTYPIQSKTYYYIAQLTDFYGTTLTASIEIQQDITVTWLDANGNVIYTEVYKRGQVPSFDTNTYDLPTKERTVSHVYTFSHWSPAVEAVTEDTVYTPIFDETTREYSIVMYTESGDVWKTMHIGYGSSIPNSGYPTKPSTELYRYVFDGWQDGSTLYTSSLPVVQQDMHLYPVYTQVYREYIITFSNGTGAIYTTSYHYGDIPSYNSDLYGLPTKSTTTPKYSKYTFSHWSPSLTSVTDNTTYVAQYIEEAIVYTVDYYVMGEVYRSQQYNYYSTIAGAINPDNITIGAIQYEFCGWDVAVSGKTVEKMYPSFVDKTLVVRAQYKASSTMQQQSITVDLTQKTSMQSLELVGDQCTILLSDGVLDTLEGSMLQLSYTVDNVSSDAYSLDKAYVLSLTLDGQEVTQLEEDITIVIRDQSVVGDNAYLYLDGDWQRIQGATSDQCYTLSTKYITTIAFGSKTEDFGLIWMAGGLIASFSLVMVIYLIWRKRHRV